MLQSGASGEDYLRQSLSPHHFREFRRLKRRLEAMGELQHLTHREDLEQAFERFLHLEASGWKGRAGTALASIPNHAAFARRAAASLASQGQCRIHELRFGGRVIASIIVLLSGRQAWTWKTAFDEEFARYSPGTLLMIELTRAHLDEREIECTDSCAVEGHPVMDRLWRERREMATLVLGLTREAARRAHLAAISLQILAKAKNAGRRLYRQIRKRPG